MSVALRNRGVEVIEVVAYTTLEAPASSRPLLERALAERPVASVLLASPSAVRGIVELAGEDLHAVVLALPTICIGPTTATAARDAGLTVLGQAERQDDRAVAELAAELLARETTGAST
jgi:uroporphyrinogen-III synthase